MSQGNENTTITGTHGKHYWLWCRDLTMSDMLKAHPTLVLNKYLAITSWDSGPFVPSDEERAMGWERRGQIAYSGIIRSINQVPIGDGYDEWYVFTQPTELGTLVRGNIFEIGIHPDQVAAFVNYGGFKPEDPEAPDLVDLFWQQYDLIQPYCFIADGDLLSVVTSDEKLFAEIKKVRCG